MAQISGVKLGRVAIGVMHMGFARLPHEQAFAALKSAVDGGANVINVATFYGAPPEPDYALKILGAFYKAYPEYMDKTVLCVKGTCDLTRLPKHNYSGELENLRKDLQFIQERIGDKKIDLYTPARQSHDVSLETLLENLKVLKAEGLFGQIGLSEIKASTLRKAAALGPIAAVENELSLYNCDSEVMDVVKACDELGISYHAYSPLGHGFLTDKFIGLDRLPEGDPRGMYPRYQGENFKKNIELAEKVHSLAKAKGYSAAQYAIAYILQLSPQIIALQGSTNADRILENNKAADIKLSQDEVKEISTILESFTTSGDRYPDLFAKDLMK